MNTMNIISIDYTVISDQELKMICDKFILNYKQMVSDRKTYKLKKVFIDISNTRLIAYTTKRDPLNVTFAVGADKEFLSMDTYRIEPEKKELDIKLDVDSILDKISKYGLNSIVKEEKDFLDNSTK